MIRRAAGVLALLCAAWPGQGQQVADPNFDTHVAHPAFAKRHPRLGIDEGHRNFHTKDGRYKPFADLMRSDGYVVSAAPAFDAPSLRRVDILVVSNALGESTAGGSSPAFTPAECDAVRDWVRGGGSLLLIADHAPFGDAAANLGERFGIDMGKGFVADTKNNEGGNPTFLLFSTENRLLGDHTIVRGRSAGERIARVVAFTGQSLSVPPAAAVLMKIANSAMEAFTEDDLNTIASGGSAGKKLAGRAQGIAMTYGKGRIAAFGEAAMFSAQVATMGDRSMKMGMNVPGNDDRQFVLNVMHWLARILD